ncbi:MAG TPA: PEP-CTERM sorting domain-containing protein [Phycisphaerales bacterium]|nr:PEP-CTERM sorting domain-containing protein [Phycisphaerales bacterium]
MRTLIVSAMALAAAATAASAGLSSVQSSALTIPSLTLPVDNTWTGDYGTREAKTAEKDWGYVTQGGGAQADTIWIDELWTGDMVTNTIGLDLFGGRERSTTTININKSVENATGFGWNGFTMTLSTINGNVNVLSSTSVDFSNIIISNNNTTSVTMVYTGGFVAAGDNADFSFSFSIPLSSVWQFTIEQTPVPTPGALGLVGVAGLVAARRRR